jgi:hypothetical protein
MAEWLSLLPDMDLISKDLLTAAASNCTGQLLDKGEVVFRASDLADSVCFIVKGRVSLKERVDSKDTIVNTLYSGQWFGEDEVLLDEGNGRRVYTAMAEEANCIVLRMPSKSFDHTLVRRAFRKLASFEPGLTPHLATLYIHITFNPQTPFFPLAPRGLTEGLGSKLRSSSFPPSGPSHLCPPLRSGGSRCASSLWWVH